MRNELVRVRGSGCSLHIFYRNAITQPVRDILIYTGGEQTRLLQHAQLFWGYFDTAKETFMNKNE